MSFINRLETATSPSLISLCPIVKNRFTLFHNTVSLYETFSYSRGLKDTTLEKSFQSWGTYYSLVFSWLTLPSKTNAQTDLEESGQGLYTRIQKIDILKMLQLRARILPSKLEEGKKEKGKKKKEEKKKGSLQTWVPKQPVSQNWIGTAFEVDD